MLLWKITFPKQELVRRALLFYMFANLHIRLNRRQLDSLSASAFSPLSHNCMLPPEELRCTPEGEWPGNWQILPY